MNRNVKGAIVVGIVAVAGYIVYKKFFDPITVVAKRKHADFPEKSYSAHLFDVKSFYKDNPDYVKNWAKSIRQGLSTFYFNGVTYNTTGGLKIK